MNLIIVVRRHRFELDLYRRWPLQRKWNLKRRYPIAVGMKGLTTEPGMFEILTKARNPDYRFPDSEWVEPVELRGTVIPGGDPSNPIAARWMGISLEEGVGIHGTFNEESIGTQASHGCIRMKQADVIELFRIVPKGTPVFVY